MFDKGLFVLTCNRCGSSESLSKLRRQPDGTMVRSVGLARGHYYDGFESEWGTDDIFPYLISAKCNDCGSSDVTSSKDPFDKLIISKIGRKSR
jgi:hypothetical protein